MTTTPSITFFCESSATAPEAMSSVAKNAMRVLLFLLLALIMNFFPKDDGSISTRRIWLLSRKKIGEKFTYVV